MENDIKDLSNTQLKKILITDDGKGKEVKELALKELCVRVRDRYLTMKKCNGRVV